MVAWSAFALKNFVKRSFLTPISYTSKNGLKGTNLVRNKSYYGETMTIRNSMFQWMKFKDILLLYTIIGCISFGSIILYTNIFIGPAKLIPIPEGYEPKHWEYYPHPISRFFARYVMFNPQERYERNLHNIFVMQEKEDLYLLEKKIMNKMKEKDDYQSWYFQKPVTKYARKSYEISEKEKMENVGKGPGVLY